MVAPRIAPLFAIVVAMAVSSPTAEAERARAKPAKQEARAKGRLGQVPGAALRPGGGRFGATLARARGQTKSKATAAVAKTRAAAGKVRRGGAALKRGAARA